MSLLSRKTWHRRVLASLLAWVACSAVAQTGDGEDEGYDCLIEAQELLDIRSPVAGLLESVPHGRGQTVEEGAVLATLESGVERAAVAAARRRAQVTGAIEAATARVELLSRKFERQSGLASEKAVSLQERDDADLERRLAEAELKQARENRELAELEYRRAAAELERRTLRSPFRGVVVDQYVHPGELVDPSSGNDPILKLARLDPLRVEVILPVELFGSIQPGSEAEVEPEVPVGGLHRVRVSIVDRIVDAQSGTFGVRLELPNPDLSVPPGVKCKVRFLEVAR